MPIDKRYQANLELLLKRATQAGDLDTALKINQLLQQMNGSPAPAAAAASTKPAPLTAAEKNLLGEWEILSSSYRGSRRLNADRTVSGGPSEARWAIDAQQLKITYGTSLVDAFDLPETNGRLTGKNTEGTAITFARKGKK